MAAEDDEVFESFGLKVVCDLKSYLYMDGCGLDYEDNMLNSRFVFHNPNAKKTCGCGAAFRREQQDSPQRHGEHRADISNSEETAKKKSESDRRM